jgi:hypothetical protein
LVRDDSITNEPLPQKTTFAVHPDALAFRFCNHDFLTRDRFSMRMILLVLLAGVATTANAQATAVQIQSVDVAAARASLSGNWEGSLEYLDYSANQWFGIPVKTSIEDQGDQATTIRKSDFDDGPKVGNVRITTVELFDAAAGTLTVGTFRKGRTVEVTQYALRIDGTPKDTEHWTMIEETLGKDDDRAAMLRLTTTRDGSSLETIKQVDFQDDDKTEWITRNRIRLTRMRD